MTRNITSQDAELLAKAKLEEKRGDKLHAAGQGEDAIKAYLAAKELYIDTGLGYHEFGDSEIAKKVRAAIKRMSNKVSKVTDPKEKRPKPTTPRPNCLACGKPLRRYKYDGNTFADGTPREWGDYGDNRFCGLSCGHRYACSVTSAKR